MPRKPKRTDAQKKADEKYAETNRAKNLANQKAKYKSRTATLTIAENARISKIFKAHKMTNANALRIVATMLESGQPLPSIDTPTDGENTDTDETPTT